MKKLFVACAVFAMLSAHARAIPPFYNTFKEKYGQPGTPLEKPIQAAKCNVCHVDQKSKKERNDYGQAVGKHLKKADFAGKGIKWDPKTPAGKKVLDEGIQKAGAEKSPAGPTFEQIIQGGKLP